MGAHPTQCIEKKRVKNVNEDACKNVWIFFSGLLKEHKSVVSWSVCSCRRESSGHCRLFAVTIHLTVMSAMSLKEKKPKRISLDVFTTAVCCSEGFCVKQDAANLQRSLTAVMMRCQAHITMMSQNHVYKDQRAVIVQCRAFIMTQIEENHLQINLLPFTQTNWAHAHNDASCLRHKVWLWLQAP